MNIIELAKQANRYASNQTNDSHDWQVIRDERFAALVRAAALEEAIDLVAFHGGSVEIEAAIRALKTKEKT